jgi:hypothetical protein
VLFDANLPLVLFPFLTWLTFIGMLGSMFIIVPTTEPDSGIAVVTNLACTTLVPQRSVLQRVVFAYYALPFVPNMVCTVFIVCKLLWHRRLLKSHTHQHSSSYSLLMSCIAESGAMYSATGILHCAFAWSYTDLQSITGAIYLASAVSTNQSTRTWFLDTPTSIFAKHILFSGWPLV